MVCEAILIWLYEVLSSTSAAIWYILSITAGIQISGLQLGGIVWSNSFCCRPEVLSGASSRDSISPFNAKCIDIVWDLETPKTREYLGFPLFFIDVRFRWDLCLRMNAGEHSHVLRSVHQISDKLLVFPNLLRIFFLVLYLPCSLIYISWSPDMMYFWGAEWSMVDHRRTNLPDCHVPSCP